MTAALLMRTDVPGDVPALRSAVAAVTAAGASRVDVLAAGPEAPARLPAGLPEGTAVFHFPMDTTTFAPERLALAVADHLAAHAYRLVVAPSALWSTDVLAYVAALRNAPFVPHVHRVDAQGYWRSVYAGNLLRAVEPLGTPVLCSTAAHPDTAGAPAGETAPSPTRVPVPMTDILRAVARTAHPRAAVAHLEDARVVVSVGAGMGTAAAVEAARRLAHRLGGSLAGSRRAVEAGWVPPEHQVGQTGKRIAPAVYIALGISGEVPHVAGIRDAEFVAAVNKDPHAPIFAHADIGIVADAPALVAQWLAFLEEHPPKN